MVSAPQSRPERPSNDVRCRRILIKLRDGEQHGNVKDVILKKNRFTDFVRIYPSLDSVGLRLRELLEEWIEGNMALLHQWLPEIDQINPRFFGHYRQRIEAVASCTLPQE